MKELKMMRQRDRRTIVLFLEECLDLRNLTESQALEVIDNLHSIGIDLENAIKKSITPTEYEGFDFLGLIGNVVAGETYLSVFEEKNSEKFESYNPAINDENFSNSSYKIEIGDEFKVLAFSAKDKSYEQRLEFSKKLNAVFPGAKGLALVFEQKLEKLPKGYSYQAIDKTDNLYTDGAAYFIPALNIPIFKKVFKFLLFPRIFSQGSDDAFLLFIKVNH